MAIAWVFPGQGSQTPGMAAGVLDLPGARERFAAASALLGRDLLAICAGEAEGELSDLNDTRNTQPALFVIESLLVDGLRAQGRTADVVAGHRLGELVALYAAGVVDAGTGLGRQRADPALAAADEDPQRADGRRRRWRHDRRDGIRSRRARSAGGGHRRGGDRQRQQRCPGGALRQP